MKVVLRVMALGGLVALTACALLPNPIFPDATRVTVDNDRYGPTTPIASDLLLVGEEVVYAVRVPQAAVNQGPLLYLEVEALNPLTDVEVTAYTALGAAYAQSSNPAYFTGVSTASALAAEDSAALAVQSITPTVSCRGPCILQPATATTVFLKIANTGIDSTNYKLYAFTEPYWDEHEPANNVPGGAVEFDGLVQGALETLGDVDYFVTAGPVSSIRIEGSAVVAPRAKLTDAITGGELGTITAGTAKNEEIFSEPKQVRVRVVSGTNRAGPSASSFYEISTTP